MKNTVHLFYSIILLSITACSTAKNIATLAPQAIINWGSTEGVRRLEESRYKTDFFTLANHFESQHNKIFCGPTSAAIAFFQRYTQNNVFLKSPKSRELVLGKTLLDLQGNAIRNNKGKPKKDRGFQLRQLAELFRAHGLSVKIGIVSRDLDNTDIKNAIIENLRSSNDYVIVNYKRSVLNQPGTGHISPLGAYHKASDSFLIMDVTPNKADWVWVKSDLLISAMRTFDTIENRGFLLIKEGRK